MKLAGDTYIIEPIGDLTNEELVMSLFGGLSCEETRFVYRGLERRGYRTTDKLILERIIHSEFHHDHIRIYHDHSHDGSLKLVYPRRRVRTG
jgi:hypothetical protein